MSTELSPGTVTATCRAESAATASVNRDLPDRDRGHGRSRYPRRESARPRHRDLPRRESGHGESPSGPATAIRHTEKIAATIGHGACPRIRPAAGTVTALCDKTGPPRVPGGGARPVDSRPGPPGGGSPPANRPGNRPPSDPRPAD